MKYQFKCDFIPQDGEVGKIILYCDDTNWVIGANASSTRELADIVQYFNAEELRKELIYSLKQISDAVGNHKNIPHKGKIIGGTQYARKSNQLVISGHSTDFGSINVEALEKCLAGLNLTIVTGSLGTSQNVSDF